MKKDRIQNLLKSYKKAQEANDGCYILYGCDVSDQECIDYLDENGYIFNSGEEGAQQGDFLFSVYEFSKINIFLTAESFANSYKENLLEQDFCILGLDIENFEEESFITRYKSLKKFINALTKNSKYQFSQAGQQVLILIKDKNSSPLEIDYSANDINNLSDDNIKILDNISSILTEDNKECKYIYLNEIIDLVKEDSSLKHILSKIPELETKCRNASLYYFSSYSDRKFKIELDSKFLDFTVAIQEVINSAQTKLIAIPAAYTFVISTINFNNIISKEFFILLGGTYIFAALIQLFISNQKSSLRLIKKNINNYKESLTPVKNTEERFQDIEKELKKQFLRIRIVKCILWGIPIVLSLLPIIKYIPCIN